MVQAKRNELCLVMVPVDCSLVGHCKEGNIWWGSNEPLELGLSLEFIVLNIIFHAYCGNARMRKRKVKLWDEWKRIQP